MTRLLLPLLVLAPLASAQIGGSQPQGLASGLASGMSLEAVNRIGLETTWVKAPLDQSKPPPAWDPADFPNSPDYSIQGLFGSLAPLVELDAHSTGNDLIAPLTASGVPNLEDFDLWLGVVASVTNGALGQQGSFIDERRQATIGRTTPGADLLSFYFEESTGIHPSLLGTTFIEQASEDIGFQGDEDVDGLDFALGVLSHSQRIHPTLLFPFVGSFFFSLEPGCVDAVNNATAGSFALDGSTWVEADAATIYEVTWSATTGQWSTRSVYLGPDDLGLDADNDDVDAVAVNIGVGTVIFSTQVVPGRSQLQVYDPAQGVFALRDAGDNLTTERLGAIDDTDDVDAVCIIDPELYTFGTHLGSPTDAIHVGNFPDDHAGLSVTRARSGLSFQTSSKAKHVLHVQCTGWGCKPQRARARLLISYDHVPGTPWNHATWHILSEKRRKKAVNVTEWELPLHVTSTGEAALGVLLVKPSGKLISGSWVSHFRFD